MIIEQIKAKVYRGGRRNLERAMHHAGRHMSGGEKRKGSRKRRLCGTLGKLCISRLVMEKERPPTPLVSPAASYLILRKHLAKLELTWNAETQ